MLRGRLISLSARLQLEPGDLPPVLDIEKRGDDVATICGKICWYGFVK